MLEILNNKISISQIRISLLTKRIYLLKEGFALKSEYEKNEIAIRLMDTEMEISKWSSILEKSYKEFKVEFKEKVLCQ